MANESLICAPTKRQKAVLRSRLLKIQREVRNLNLHLKQLVDSASIAYIITSGAYPTRRRAK